MAELASLGIEVQANNVDQASSKLDKLSGAAKRAEAAVDGLGPASSKAGQMAARAADEAKTALNAEAVAATKAAGAMRLHAQAANQNMRGMNAASLNVGNLAAQFQDIAVTSAMSMNPLQIALQQGTQISAVGFQHCPHLASLYGVGATGCASQGVVNARYGVIAESEHNRNRCGAARMR